ncbi:MAG: ATP-binding protein [Legionellales bacterium]|nr:ATP-binding protein [Legionellales bacterium]
MSQKIEVYFPTGIVTGSAFCNREEERAYLKKRLDQNAHVVLMSPRRYGKSSLIAQFTSEHNTPFSAVDLLPATSGKYVKNAIIDGVTQLLDNIMPSSKKAKQKIMGYFAKMNPTIELSAFGQKIKLAPEEKTPEETIMKLLIDLDHAAKEINKKLIFVMDEFQQIATLEHSHALEASIRHAVERSRHVFYIFSGSNRTLLEEMFSNKDRPLYHLCDEMKLNRIDPLHYRPFIEKASKKTWKSPISKMSIDKILSLTECHPYYVNRLCRALWDLNQAPVETQIEATWQHYVNSQKSDWILDMLSRLTANQRAILTGLAKSPEKKPRGKDFSTRIGLSPSSIQRTLSTLLKQDLIYSDRHGDYHVLNPVIKSVLAKDKYFD